MKKIMITIAAITIAVVSQAATCNWQAGYLYAPDASGNIATWSGTKWTFGSKLGDAYAVKMYVWESLTEQAFSAGDLFKKYQDNQLTGSIAGTYDSATSQANATGVLVGDPGQSQTIYGNVLFVLEDKVTGDAVWYMENSGSKAASTGTVKVNALGMYENGDSKSSAMTWSAVPEPTSGLLLLLGMAGLALRRRRA